MADVNLLRIPLEDIVNATNNFANENLIKVGEFADVYEGQLRRSEEPIDVIVRRIHPSFVKKIVENRFQKEIQTLADLKHEIENTVSIVGFCDENGEMMMIMERAVNGGLDKHLSDPNLTWSQRLYICLRVALVLEHIWHIDGGERHHDIKSSKILLDKDWEPKLFCFGFRMDYDVVFYKTTVYTHPEFINTRWSYDSNFYSLGVIMFEVLCGRKANESLLSLMLKQREQVVDMIDSNLWKQMHPESLSIFLETIDDCLHTNTMGLQIVGQLREALEIQSIKENIEENFAYMKIPLDDIMVATKNFAKTYSIGSQRDGMLYQAQLDHFDHTTLLTTKWKNKGALPKTRSTVIIKRINNQDYKVLRKKLLAEIEILTSCKNPNIASLLGFSWEGSEVILIYADVFTSLHKYLSSTDQSNNLTLEQRIRISIGIVDGWKYLVNNIQQEVLLLHPMIQTGNVFLDEKLNAKIILELKGEVNQDLWWGESEYIYYIGVILVKMLIGSLDAVFMVTEQHDIEEEIKKNMDPRIKEEVQESNFNNKGHNQDSLTTFLSVTSKCMAFKRNERPTLEAVIKSLKKALPFQVRDFEHLKIQLRDIKLATGDFDEKCCIGRGGYGAVYKGELNHFDISTSLATDMKNNHALPMKHSTVAIKHILNRDDDMGKEGFLVELKVLSRCKHPNIVSLIGFCDEGDEMILVYELASNGSLEAYLENTTNKTNLTWVQRLKMCIEIAQGLCYLHTSTEDKNMIIHRDVKSANILLGENWEAKIADFGLSKVPFLNQEGSTINTKNVAGTDVYLDPEYERTGKLKKESDIYSFGVVLFEILSGKLAYDSSYTRQNKMGLAPVARRHFKQGTLNKIIDPEIIDEAHGLSSTLKIGPDHNSLDRFSKIAYQCLAKIQSKRPTIEVVIKELKEALNFQVNRKDTYKIPLEDIKLISNESFVDNNSIEGGFGMIYNGQVRCENGHKNVAVKRFRSSTSHEYGLPKEFDVLYKHKHENIIGLEGYCKEMDEEMIVYEHVANGSLDMHLKDPGFTWTQRLKICIDIAKGLNFIHEGDAQKEDVVIHRDIKSSNILLTRDWKAKICGFELSLISSINQKTEYVVNDVLGTPGYCDPTYWETHFLTKESDIYSLGIVLFEMLCGRLAYPQNTIDQSQFLDDLVKHHYKLGRLDEIVFEGIEGQIALKSLATFRRIAFQCLHKKREERPTAGEVVLHLQKALKIQEDYEVWDAKLPRNYKEIIGLSNSPEIYFTKKEIYNILSSGILLQQGKVLFSIGSNGERNEMISSRMFSYKNRWSHRWRSTQGSRFQNVAEILDVSNLNIQIKIRPQLLSPNVNYSAYIVFKFCGPRKSHAKRMYVNLKYKIGHEDFHAYFATCREDDWMLIELYQSKYVKADTNLEVLLERFSRCYCDSRAIYIQGIEFRAIDHVKQEAIEQFDESQQVSTLNAEMDKLRISIHAMKSKRFSLHAMKNKRFSLHAMKSKRHEVPANWIFYDSSDNKLYPTSQSRTRGIIKLLRDSVFSIKWKIEGQKGKPITEYTCYLVFKLSENCSGLHCPVIVRDQFSRKTKNIVYFRSPSPWNLNDTDQVPKKRGDGWMEVIVWKFKSNYELKKDFLSLDLKLISYEGTMSGLVVRSIEFKTV